MSSHIVAVVVAAAAAATAFAYMSHRAAVEAVRARNAAVSWAGRRALVIGGTSGIGEGIAIRLARSGADVTVMGRDAARGAAVVAAMRAAASAAPGMAPAAAEQRLEFQRCDASLLGEGGVRDCAAAFDRSLGDGKLDALILTQGIATMQGRTETREGVDVKLALHYFGRMAAVDSLLPALRRRGGERPAAVLSVLSAGVHSAYAGYAEDPELRHNYSLKNAADAAGLYNDVAADALSRDPANANVTFIHAAPGFVNTRWGTDMPWLVRMAVRAIQPLAMSAADCAEFMCDPVFAAAAAAGPGSASSGAGGGSAAAAGATAGATAGTRGWRLVGSQAQDVSPTAVHARALPAVWTATRDVLRRAGLDGGIVNWTNAGARIPLA